jgi:hypothetical protein
VIVGMVPMVLWELYLPLSLRGHERSIGGLKKRKRYWRIVGARKNIAVPNMTVLRG